MNNDAPISEFADDRLGLGSIAKQLANSLKEKNLFSGGFVIGLEGPWGSGKSSLFNLTDKILSGLDDGPEVIRFSPWIVGNRNQLLKELFAELNAVIIKKLSHKSFRIKSLLEQYEKIASSLAPVAEVAEIFVPGAGMVSKGLKKTGEAASKFGQHTLSDLRTQLLKELEEFEQHIVVFVDDIDRLEPEESVEMLRLIRAVADFPYVTYLLAYDAEVLASSLEKAIKVPNGKVYLDKVVQASFSVPVSDSHDLKIWMMKEIEELGIVNDNDVVAKEELRISVLSWCDRFISSPRDIVRVLNSIKLYVSPQKDRVYPADAVFLQIVRTKCPALYNWIEEYLLWLHSPVSVQSNVKLIDPTNVNLFQKNGSYSSRLDNIVSKLVGEDSTEKHAFITQLIKHVPQSPDEDPHSQQKCRLKSPHHFRLYFAFSVRSGDLSDDEISQFLEWCVNDPEKAISRFRDLSETSSPRGGVMMGEVLLDRVLNWDDLSPDKIEKILLVLGDSIEKLACHSEPDFGYAQFLRGEKNQIIGLIGHLNQDRRKKVLETIFRSAPSWAWLSGIIRSSIRQQGLTGFESKPKSDWLLTESEFELVRKIYAERLKNEEPGIILKTPPPYFLHLLHAWYITGNAQDVIAWINRQSSNDSGFMDLLSNMTSWSNDSSMGVRYTIRTETLTRYFPDRKVQEMLIEIRDNMGNSAEMRKHAKQLLESIEGV